MLQGEDLVKACAGYMLEKKGQQIISLDLRGISVVADFFLVATASNTPQAKAIADHVKDKLAEEAILPLRVEGYREGRWILLDYGTMIIHIFQEEERQYYNLERLWGDAPTTAYTPKIAE